jgi:ASC-1-like (ASCH) protein
MKKHVLKFRATDKAEFETIVNGRKTVETRANTVSFKNYEVGDILVIKCGNESVEKSIINIQKFDSVADCIGSVGLKNVMPLFKGTPKEAEKLWYSFPGYKEKITQHGLVAFYI